MSDPESARRRALLKSGLALASVGAASGAQGANTAESMRAWEMGPRRDGLSLRLVERPVPSPGPGEALLKVYATGLNARDLDLLRGIHIYGADPNPPSRIPLDDNAGEVLAVGDGVTRVKPGDRVITTHFPLWIDGDWHDESMSIMDFSVTTDGFLAERAVVPADALVKIPDSLTYEQACTLPNAGLTAWHGVIEGGETKPGQTVLTLGTGGVSVFGFQWAQMAGARVAITSSSDDKLARMRAMGASITVNYRRNPDWHEEILEQTGGRGVDVVLNNVGIGETERCLRSCASNGRVMLIGANPVARDGQGNAPAGLANYPRPMIMKKLSIRSVLVGSRRMLEDLVRAANANGIKPVIDRVYGFEEIEQAVDYMKTGSKVGKIVIRVSESRD